MAWNTNYKNNVGAGAEYEAPTSLINEAWLKMTRIHELQKTIDYYIINPLAFNFEFGVYNYQIRFNCACALMQEVWGKLSEEEKKDIISMKKAIENIIDKYPIFENKQNVALRKNNQKLNRRNWDVIEDWLNNFELKIRELISRSGYDSPNKDDYSSDDF